MAGAFWRAGRKEVSVVALALLGRSKDRVGFADGDELLGLGWVIGMKVGVMGFG